MLALALALLLQAAAPGGGARIPVQLGVRITPDSVTVGQRFVVIVRVRAPRGATIEFPDKTDSAATASPTAAQLIGKPVVQAVPDSSRTTMSAAFRLVAWDIGPQRLALGDIVVRYGGQTGYIALGDRTVFVRSVLPADSMLRVSKPLRPRIDIAPYNWMPLAFLALAAAMAALLWRIFIWYRRRRSAPLGPFAAAERAFNRIEALRLSESGEAQRHVALMSDVMREYLVARVPGIARSHTSSELLAASGDVHLASRGMGDLLWRADLVKFAGLRVDSDEASRLGASARGIVRSVEEFLLDVERRDQDRKEAA